MNLNTILKSDLRKFGLNPEEWQIRRENRATFLIVHKVDREFQLIGRIRQGVAQTTWLKIALKQL